MALTIGHKIYSGSRDFKSLQKDAEFMNHLRDEAGNHGYNERAIAEAVHKLGNWVKGDKTYRLQTLIGRKGQNKSFSTHKEVVTWLFYKQQRTFVENQVKEKELAKKINDNKAIRKQCFELKEKLCKYIKLKLNDDSNRKDTRNSLKTKLKSTEGRYAHFYSKLFFNRTLYEGYEYFRKKSLNDISRSEFAAFLADLALIMRDYGVEQKHIANVEILRYNAAALDAEFDVIEQEMFNAIAPEVENRNKMLSDFGLDTTANKSDYKLYSSLSNLIGHLSEKEKKIAAAKKIENYKQSQVNKFLRIHNTGKTGGPSEPSGDLETRLKKIYSTAKEKKMKNASVSKKEKLFTDNEIKEIQQYVNAFQSQDFVKKIQEDIKKDISNLSTDDKRDIARRGNVKRINYNVAVENSWADFMMKKQMTIGAGPSSTTMLVLSLVKAMSGTARCNIALFDAACILFAFWQRKKRQLRGQGAIHTWNEVCVAFDSFTGWGKNEWLEVLPLDSEKPIHCRIYPYPCGFDIKGRPVYPEPTQDNQ